VSTAVRLAQLLRNRKALGAAWLTVADVMSKAIGFAMTPYLANRMGAAGFGQLSLYISVTQILPIVIALGGIALLAVEYIRNGYTSARRMRAANLRLSLWISLGLLGLSLFISWWKPSILPLSAGLLVLAVSCVQALNTLELAYYRGSQTYSFAVAGQFAFAGLNVVLTVLAFEFDSPTVTNRLLSIALAGGLVQLVYALDLRRKHYEPADRDTTRANTRLIISFGLTVLVHAASQWIRSNIDRFVIATHFGLGAAGTYSVAIAMATVPSVFFTAVSQQLQPYLYRRLKDRKFSEFKRVQLGYVSIVLLLTGLYYFLLLAIFPLLFDSEYDAAKTLLPALLGASAAFSIYHVFSHAGFYERRGGLIASVTGGALAIHLIGLAGLLAFDQITPSHVALTFLISSAVATLGMAILSSRTVRQLRLAQPERTERK
jgi:O-antigen/teichoic acid export membrane protein